MTGTGGEQGTAEEQTHIRHEPVGCVVAEEFSVIGATLVPDVGWRDLRVMFRTDSTRGWASVDLFFRGDDEYSGVLPRARAGLRFTYFIEGEGPDGQVRRTPEHAVRAVPDAVACGEGRVAPTRPETPELYVQVPEGTRGLPKGFSSRNTVAVRHDGRPFKGRIETAFLGVGLLGGAAAGVALAAGGGPPLGAGDAGVQRSVAIVGATPPPGSAVPAVAASLSLTLLVTSSRPLEPGYLRVTLHSGTPDNSTTCGILYADHPGGTSFQATALGPEVPGLCRARLPVHLGSARVFVFTRQGVQFQTGPGGIGPDLPVDYQLLP